MSSLEGGIQLRKINPDTTTEKQKYFETTFKDLDVSLTKLLENNSGYYAKTDEAAAVNKLTSLKANELFKKINLKPIIPPEETGYTPKKRKSKNHETEENNCTYVDIAKTAIQQTNQPTPALTPSNNTRIKLAALVIEAHIASLAKTESYGTILSKSLKRNFNIDTSFSDRDSQKIFNLFINPTPNPEPAPLATPNTNVETIFTHHDMESESEQSSTERNDTQDQNSDNTEPEQPWETRPKKKPQRKGRKPAPLLINTPPLTPANSKPHLSKAQHNSHRSQLTPQTSGSLPNSQKTTRKSRSKYEKETPNEVWKQISVNKIHLNQLPIYAMLQQDFDEIPHSPKNLTHKRPKHTT
ncbi:hypothetical protein FHG87_020316 [Trinorchestia longiramus]|nr:hypothetical protein FHG87_020316 [Trinorchestia longiramus]